MATFYDSFEGGTGSWAGDADSGAGCSYEINSNRPYSGSDNALFINESSGDGRYILLFVDLAAADEYYFGCCCQFTAVPALSGAKFTVMKVRNAANSAQWRVTVGRGADGIIEWGLNESATGTSYTYDYNIALNTYYWIECKCRIGNGTGELRLYLGNKEIITQTGKSYGTSQLTRFYGGYQTEVGFSGSATNIYIDDFFVDVSRIGHRALPNVLGDGVVWRP